MEKEDAKALEKEQRPIIFYATEPGNKDSREKIVKIHKVNRGFTKSLSIMLVLRLAETERPMGVKLLYGTVERINNDFKRKGNFDKPIVVPSLK